LRFSSARLMPSSISGGRSAMAMRSGGSWRAAAWARETCVVRSGTMCSPTAGGVHPDTCGPSGTRTHCSASVLAVRRRRPELLDGLGDVLGRGCPSRGRPTPRRRGRRPPRRPCCPPTEGPPRGPCFWWRSLLCGVEPVEAGHRHVHQDHVRAVRLGQFDGPARRPRPRRPRVIAGRVRGGVGVRFGATGALSSPAVLATMTPAVFSPVVRGAPLWSRDPPYGLAPSCGLDALVVSRPRFV